MSKKICLLFFALLGASPLLTLQQGCVGNFPPLNVMVLTATFTPTTIPPTSTPTPILGTSPDFIDDMEDNNNGVMTNQGRNGYWYAYNDGSGGGVQQTGGVTSPFTMGAPGVGYDGTGASLYAVRISTNASFTNWGSGFGFSFTGATSDYDASTHTGIQFYAKNTPGTLAFKFIINDNAVATAVPAYSVGGHRANFNLTSSWTLYQVGLAYIASQPNDYGGPTVFDPSRVRQCQWSIPPGLITDVWIDNVAFY